MRKEKLERKRVKKEFDKNRDCGMWNDGRGRDSGRRQMRDVGAWSYACVFIDAVDRSSSVASV